MARLEPPNVVQAVERYVEQELMDFEKYTNRKPLDESGVWSLHRLAADIYAQGWADGERAEADRARGERQRRPKPTQPVERGDGDGGRADQ